ncbi:MAG TPA: segregation and condensation protein A [Cyclobacteriaceae bacterium]
MSFEIKTPLFEGPFDLLLFFIERDEINIYDIPIYKITNDFIEYINHLERMNIEVASEFILVASKLMNIKAKMLLPRPSFNEEGEEIDPRDELVKHLLEYKKFKLVVGAFEALEKHRQSKVSRGSSKNEIKRIAQSVNVEAELQSIDLYKLFRVYQKVLTRLGEQDQQSFHTIDKFQYTIEGQKEFILNRLEERNQLSFYDLVDTNPTRIAAIFNFLAILEMINSQLIRIVMGIGYNNFWIRINDN